MPLHLFSQLINTAFITSSFNSWIVIRSAGSQGQVQHPRHICGDTGGLHTMLGGRPPSQLGDVANLSGFATRIPIVRLILFAAMECGQLTNHGDQYGFEVETGWR